MENIAVHLEEDTQIIVQKVVGTLSPEAFDLLYKLTAECAARLNDPGNILILVDASEIGRTSLATRKRGIGAFDENGIRKMAFCGGSRISRTMQRIVIIVLGESRVRMFKGEAEARAWLLT